MNCAFKCKKHFCNIAKIKYKDLVATVKHKSALALKDLIELGYGSNGLGTIVVTDVPNHYETKKKLLLQAHKLAYFPEADLKNLESPETNYSVGWSYGKEKLGDVPDLLKASYYAKLQVFDELANNKINTQMNNIWPNNKIPTLESNFMDLGNQIRAVSFMLYEVIDKYITSKYPSYSLQYKNIISASDHNVGRLLYYYPKKHIKGDFTNWCEWHNDHGSLTGLVSAIFLDEHGNELTDGFKLSKTGLWIQKRNGEYFRFTYGKNDIAFQIGETLQVESGGLLHATPHAVKVEDDMPDNIARATFALFMEPSMSHKLSIPAEANVNDITTSNIYTVPKIQDRYVPGMTFGEFNDATINYYYRHLKK